MGFLKSIYRDVIKDPKDYLGKPYDLRPSPGLRLRRRSAAEPNACAGSAGPRLQGVCRGFKGLGFKGLGFRVLAWMQKGLGLSVFF